MSWEPVGANGCGYNVLLCPLHCGVVAAGRAHGCGYRVLLRPRHYGHKEGSAVCCGVRLERTAAAATCVGVPSITATMTGVQHVLGTGWSERLRLKRASVSPPLRS